MSQTRADLVILGMGPNQEAIAHVISALARGQWGKR